MAPRPAAPEGADAIASALRVISRARGRPFRMDTQDGRFRIQKTVYLLRRLGYPPARAFDYNLYHMGPYSPMLAKVYYALGNPGLASAEPATDLDDLILETVKEALAGTDHFLEALSTSLSVYSPRLPVSKAYSRAKSIKPHIGAETWGEVERYLNAHPQLITPT